MNADLLCRVSGAARAGGGDAPSEALDEEGAVLLFEGGAGGQHGHHRKGRKGRKD